MAEKPSCHERHDVRDRVVTDVGWGAERGGAGVGLRRSVAAGVRCVDSTGLLKATFQVATAVQKFRMW